MKRQSFSIVFFIRKTRLNKKGETPVMARITYHGVRAEFQTKRDVLPSKWNVAKEKVNVGKSILICPFAPMLLAPVA